MRADAADELSGMKGYIVKWDENPDTEPAGTTNAKVSETIKSPELADGKWYLHVKAVDNAGNESKTMRSGPFLVDMGVQPPDIASDTHVPEEWSLNRIVGIKWIYVLDKLSGLKGYSA